MQGMQSLLKTTSGAVANPGKLLGWLDLVTPPPMVCCVVVVIIRLAPFLGAAHGVVHPLLIVGSVGSQAVRTAMYTGSTAIHHRCLC